MTRTRSFARIATVALLAMAVALPIFAARGKADFTRFVAIGDSYGAGYEAGSLNLRHQIYSWPAVVAKQEGLTICPPTAVATDNCWAVPLIADPGLPSGELVFNGVTVVQTPGAGAPLMSGFGRPFNNLSVPGYTVGAALTLKGTESNAGLGLPILRGLGAEVDQALLLNPTFIAIWLGGNDFLGAVSQGNPGLLTTTANFQTQYNAMLDKLIAGAPNAGMVVGTLPTNFASAPLTSRLPAVIFDSSFKPVQFPAPINGTVPFFYVPADSSTPAAVPAGSIVLLSALSRIQQGYGIPPTLKTIAPFSSLPHTGEPLTDAEVITPAEQATFATRISDYNNIITAAASARDIPVADVKGLFDRFATGMSLGGVTLTNTFVSGGIFSNDGVHLTDIGYTLMGNEFIKAINRGYGTHTTLASITQFFANNGANFEFGANSIISPAVSQSMISIFQEPQAPKKRVVGRH